MGKTDFSKSEYLLSDIYSKGEIIVEKIKTKVVIDRDNPYYSYCLLFPSKEEYHKLNLFELELRGCVKDVGGNTIRSVHIPCGYYEEGYVKSYAENWQEREIRIRPREILLKHSRGNNDGKGEIVFSLTDNSLIRSSRISLGEKPNSFELKDFKPKVTLNFSNGDSLIFDEFLSGSYKEKESVSIIKQVIKVVQKNINEDSQNEKLKENIEHLLWFLSFVSNERTYWISWNIQVKREIAEFFRCNIRYVNADNGKDESFIESDYLQEFLQISLERIERTNAYSLYLPLVYFVGAKEKTLEFKFLALFMSLVVLLNLFCKSQAETTFIKDEVEAKNFITHMKNAIEAFNFSNPKVKEFIVRKLGNLNDISIKLQFERFCDAKNVTVSDLWPLFDDKIKMPLYRIRNKLMHGENLSDFSNLDIACEHLKWIVVRCLMADLGWYKSSGVDSKELMKNQYYSFKGA